MLICMACNYESHSGTSGTCPECGSKNVVVYNGCGGDSAPPSSDDIKSVELIKNNY